MPGSQFSWLAYSERERRRMLDVVHSFDEKGTRDELGIGVVRDGLADILFPGTGTVQTSARYFLIIPWIYRDHERRRTPSHEIAGKARKAEIDVIRSLEAGGEHARVIGIEARDALQRLPSSIYWQGLATWGIRIFPGSRDEYHRRLDRWYALNADRTPADPGEKHETGGPRPNWHAGLPDPPSDWRSKLTFQLTPEDARYLRDCILNRAPGSLLANLVTRDKTLGESAYCWESEVSQDFPARNRGEVEHGRNFSEAMHGAAVLYNLMLAETAKNEERRDEYRTGMTQWAELVTAGQDRLGRWNREDFWKLLRAREVRIPSRTYSFISAWLDLALSEDDPAGLADSAVARRLVRQRESDLKKGLSRLTNPRALELWTGAAGMGRMDFRWRVSRQIVNDILEGLGHA